MRKTGWGSAAAARLATAALVAGLIAVPAALAAHKPGHPAKMSTFVVKGTVTAATIPGTIQLTVAGGNRAALKIAPKGASASFTAASTTRIASVGGIAAGDTVVVRVRAPRDASSAALAATPALKVVETGAASPEVMYVVRGTVTSFAQAADGAGTIAVTVVGGNKHARAAFGTSGPQTFMLGSTTKIAATGTIATGERVLVKLRAPKGAAAATLTGDTVDQVVELGA